MPEYIKADITLSILSDNPTMDIIPGISDLTIISLPHIYNVFFPISFIYVLLRNKCEIQTTKIITMHGCTTNTQQPLSILDEITSSPAYKYAV